MMISCRAALAAAIVACTATPAAAEPSLETLREQVIATERAFARSMAERDLTGFTKLLSEQAVFFTGPKPLRGKAEITAVWKRWYEGPKAPFSWEPDEVEVLEDGTLAHSSGPVRDESGRLVSRFNSVWRQEAPGVWRIVFDRGSPLSDEEKKKAAAGG